MKKTALAATMAGLLFSHAAVATTTLYGQINQAVSFVDGNNFRPEGTAPSVEGKSVRIHNGVMSDVGDTIFGVGGEEELGNGLKAVFQIEFVVDLNGSDNVQTSPTGGSTQDDHALEMDNTFVGLEGGFGTLTIGRMDTPAHAGIYEIYGMMGGYTMNLNFISELTTNNMLNYTSPDFNGFNFSLATIAGEQTGDNSADSLSDGMSASASFSNDNLYVMLGYTSMSKKLVGTDKDTNIFGAGIKYTTDRFGIGYAYEKIKSADNTGIELTVSDLDYAGILGGDANEYESHLLIGSYTFTKRNTVSVEYGMGKFNDANKTERALWALAVEHRFSERTKAFVSYSTAEDKNTEVRYDSSVASIGLLHSF
jgi:predicted porin